MAYPKKIWSETVKETVYPTDLNRIENGIEANDLEITKQKNPTIPGTLAKQIADNVTAIEENTNKINVLNDYKYHPTITTPNNLPSGKWYLRSLDNPTDDFYFIDCGSSPVSGYAYQRARYLFGEQSYERVQREGVWQPWQQIATTTKTSFLCTANPGYTIVGQQCYTLNGEAHINVSVKRTDNQTITAQLMNPVTVPYGTSEETCILALIRNEANVIINTSPCVINYTGGLYVNVQVSGSIISFYGRIPI